MKKSILFALLLIGTSAIISCKKEGCTDLNATNFDPDANTDNSACVYESDLVFWYNESTAEFLNDNFITSLTYYVDGVIVGSSAANVYFTAAPLCGTNGSITVTKDLGIAKNKTYSYEVISDLGTTVWEGAQNFTANTCFQLQLTK